MQGVLKNSYDQSNEDKPAKDVQTEDILNEDFENQCPEDFFKIFTKKTDDFEEDYLNLAHTHRFIQLLSLNLSFLIRCIGLLIMQHL